MQRLALAIIASSGLGKDVKVLSFVGQNAGVQDVDNQHMCFEKDLFPGIIVRGTKSKTISAETLKGYDVVLMPGGYAFYTNQPDVDVEAIQEFVKGGGGYFGTCAGAFGGCTSINADPATGIIDPYTNRSVAAVQSEIDGTWNYPREAGMGVSRANCHTFSHTGTTVNTISAIGEHLLGTSGDFHIDHNNGPAMDGGGQVVATFANLQKGMNSIVVDTYGSGRSVLISPHPEHEKLQNCGLVTWAAAYAAGLDAPPPSPVPPPSGQCQALTAAVSYEWCEDNCNLFTPYCPPDLCECTQKLRLV